MQLDLTVSLKVTETGNFPIGNGDTEEILNRIQLEPTGSTVLTDCRFDYIASFSLLLLQDKDEVKLHHVLL